MEYVQEWMTSAQLGIRKGYVQAASKGILSLIEYVLE